MHFTEFCRFSPEITFFLVNGQVPTRAPFSMQSTSFNPDGLKVKAATGGQFAIYDTSHKQVLAPVETEKEAEQLLKLLQHYKFDHTCQQKPATRYGLKFLVKGGH